MTPAEAVRAVVYGHALRAVVYGHAHGVPTFDALLVETNLLLGYDASATEIDAAARPYQVGRPGAHRYEREDGPGHCQCQSDVDDIGPKHLASCPWNDPDYPRDEDGEPTCPF